MTPHAVAPGGVQAGRAITRNGICLQTLQTHYKHKIYHAGKASRTPELLKLTRACARAGVLSKAARVWVQPSATWAPLALVNL